MSLKYLTVVLCSNAPKVRSCVAEKLQVAILTFDENIFTSGGVDPAKGEDYDEDERNRRTEESLKILSETDWSQMAICDLRLIRNNLCSVLGIPAPATSSASVMHPS